MRKPQKFISFLFVFLFLWLIDVFIFGFCPSNFWPVCFFGVLGFFVLFLSHKSRHFESKVPFPACLVERVLAQWCFWVAPCGFILRDGGLWSFSRVERDSPARDGYQVSRCDLPVSSRCDLLLFIICDLPRFSKMWPSFLVCFSRCDLLVFFKMWSAFVLLQDAICLFHFQDVICSFPSRYDMFFYFKMRSAFCASSRYDLLVFFKMWSAFTLLQDAICFCSSSRCDLLVLIKMWASPILPIYLQDVIFLHHRRFFQDAVSYSFPCRARDAVCWSGLFCGGPSIYDILFLVNLEVIWHFGILMLCAYFSKRVSLLGSKVLIWWAFTRGYEGIVFGAFTSRWSVLFWQEGLCRFLQVVVSGGLYFGRLRKKLLKSQGRLDTYKHAVVTLLLEDCVVGWADFFKEGIYLALSLGVMQSWWSAGDCFCLLDW